MARLKSGTRIYGTATIDTNLVVGSVVTLSSSGIQSTAQINSTSTVSGTNITTGGNVTGSSASCTGNASTASTLQTARNIGGTSFNGGADITPFRSNTLTTVDGGIIQASATTYSVRSASSTPQQYANGVNWEFKNAAVVGGAGNYAGLLTLAPWAGTSASTGDPNYQLAFSPVSANSTAVPTLQIRAGIDATWGSWATILNSTSSLNATNLGSGTVPLARLGASGTASNTTFLRGDNSWATPTATVSTLTLATSGTGLSGSASYTGASPITFTVTSNATNVNTLSTIVARDGSGNFSAGTITASLTGSASNNVLKAGDTMTGQLISTRANSTADGGGQIYLNGTGGNRIDFNIDGVGAPSLTTRSAGTKIVLAAAVSGAAVDYALGIETFTLWSSVPSSSHQFKWYAGTTTVGTLSGAGALSVTGTVSGTNITTGGNVTGSSASVANAVTFNNSGTGDATGTTFNGSAARTISYNTLGASPLAGSSSLTTTGTVTTGTWSGNFGAVSGVNLTNLTAGNLTGTIPSAVLGNSVHFIGTTSIALNRATASQTLTGVSIDGSAGSVANAVTFNSGGTGAASGTTFNGSAAQTISHNTLGASPLAGSTSIVTTGTVTTGTWSGSFGAVSGANLTTLNASNLSSGTVATARLGTGTANNTTFLRGDNTWATVSGGSSITVADDTTTNAVRYIVFEDITSGTSTTIGVASTKLTFNPSTGTLSVDGAVEIGATDSATQKFSINFNETTDSLDFDYTA